MDCAGRWRWTSLHIDVSHLESCFFFKLRSSDKIYYTNICFYILLCCIMYTYILQGYERDIKIYKLGNMLKRETKFTKLENKHRYVLHFTSLAIPNVNYNM